MEAKDTVMSTQETRQAIINNLDVPIDQAVAQAQAEASFKAGMKEVVDWVDRYGIWGQVFFAVKEETRLMWCLFPERWREAHREWGIE